MRSPPLLAKPDLLIVDDDPLITDTLDFVLGRDFNVYVADSRAQVKSLLRQLEAATRARADRPRPAADAASARRRLPADQRAARPFAPTSRSSCCPARTTKATRATRARSAPSSSLPSPASRSAEALLLAARVQSPRPNAWQTADPGIIGSGPAITKLKQQIRQYAECALPGADRRRIGQRQGARGSVLLHRQSARAMKPYLALNCAAISPNLVEATLFGYAKGAFTGASCGTRGLFRGCPRRHPVSRRDRRAAARAAGQAAARARERRIPARRRDPEPDQPGARDRRDQPRPATGG